MKFLKMLLKNKVLTNKMDASDEQVVEQITKTPPPNKKKIKDPKKVSACRKLAEYNKKAKEKQKLVLQNNKEKNNEMVNETVDEVGSNFLPETSFTTIIAFLGLGLTAVDLFLRYKSSKLTQSAQSTQSTQSTQPDYDASVDSKKEDEEKKLIGME